MKCTTNPLSKLNLYVKIVHYLYINVSAVASTSNSALVSVWHVTCDSFHPFQQRTDVATTCLQFAFNVVFGKVWDVLLCVFGYVVPTSGSVRPALCSEAAVNYLSPLRSLLWSSEVRLSRLYWWNLEFHSLYCLIVRYSGDLFYNVLYEYYDAFILFLFLFQCYLYEVVYMNWNTLTVRFVIIANFTCRLKIRLLSESTSSQWVQGLLLWG
jgi:hypothetical protein